MKTLTSYSPFDRFIFRTPLFPFEYLNKEEELMNKSAFTEAALIASPELSKEVSKFQKTTEIPHKEKERIVGSLYRYYQRACTRPTPFGLFAGCSTGIIGDVTKIRLLERQQYKRTTRLDMNYICALTQHIEKDRNIREQLCFYPNSSMYPIGDHLRYVEYHYRKTRRVHQITQIDNSEYLQQILHLASGGALFSELVKVLIDEEITPKEAADFIHELIDSQVLVSELEPAVTNIRPLISLINRIKGLSNADNQIIDILSEIDLQLNSMDQQPIGTTGNVYPAIIENIEKTQVAAEIKYLFQTDMYKPTKQATVSRNMIRDIQQALTFLNKITMPASQTNLSKFKEDFSKRYEDREMPLLFVLDNESGIGYAGNNSGDVSPLVDDLAIPQRISSSNASQNPIQSLLLQKYHQHKFQKAIELTDEDVKDFTAVWDDMPPTISVLCKLFQDNEQGRLFYIKSAGGYSAANLLGRFCHLDEQIINHTLAIIDKEAHNNPDAVFAEIVHLPESGTGNILLRPVLRPYEIAYLARSGVSDEFVIRPDDLYVSINNNCIRLRSKRLNKEIIPRMSTAHNYRGPSSMPVYHFLCDIQHQNGRVGFGFAWNDTVQKLDYVPRVVYKNCILSQARWMVREKETKAFIGIKDDNALLQKIKEWQTPRNIPDKVVLVDGDNELFVDLNHPLSIRAWLSVVKKRSSFQLEEFLFDPKTAIVHGPEGVFTNEFIFAFYRRDG